MYPTRARAAVGSTDRATVLAIKYYDLEPLANERAPWRASQRAYDGRSLSSRSGEEGRLRSVISIGAVTYLNSDFTRLRRRRRRKGGTELAEANWGQRGGMEDTHARVRGLAIKKTVKRKLDGILLTHFVRQKTKE